MHRVITYPAFKGWLESQDPVRSVGGTDSLSNYPLIRFLEAAGHPEGWVLSDYYTVEPAATPQELPKWAKSFVDRVSRHPHAFVTAKEALIMLRRARNYPKRKPQLLLPI